MALINKFVDILNEVHTLLSKKNQLHNDSIIEIYNINHDKLIGKVIENELSIVQQLNAILHQSYINFLSHIYSKEISTFILNYLNIREKPIQDRINLFTIDKLIFHIYHRLVLSDEYKDLIKNLNLFLQSDNYDAIAVKRILNIINDINKVYYEIDDIHNNIITSISFTNISALMNMISISSDANKNMSSKIAIKIISIKPKCEFEDVIIDINTALEKIIENFSQLNTITRSSNTNTNNTKKPFKAISLSNNRIKTKRVFPLLKKAEELFKEELKIKDERTLSEPKLARQSLVLLECLTEICYSLSIFLDVSFVLLSRTTLFTESGGDKLSILSITMLSNLQQIYETFLLAIDQYFKDKEVGQSLQDISLLCKKRIIKIVSILMRSTIHYLLNDNTINITTSNNNDGVTWMEEFQRQLDSQNCGLLLSDTTRFYKRTVWQLLSLLTNDEIQTQYMLKALSAPNGLLNKYSTQNNIVDNKTNNNNNSKDEDVQNANNYHATLETLVEFFPDYGKGFLLAVLSTFEFNVDSTVEAIFTDNLPTKLAMMDRKTTLIKKGKEDKMAKVGIFGLPEDIEFKRQLIERVRKMEQEREYDFMLLEQEYADDYDDQYDHPEGALNINDGLGSDKAKDKKKVNEQVKVDWDKRMSDMKRLNRLTKEEEDEQTFWESMKNDNRTVRFIQPKSYDDDYNNEDAVALNSNKETVSTTFKSNLRVTATEFQPSILSASIPSVKINHSSNRKKDINTAHPTTTASSNNKIDSNDDTNNTSSSSTFGKGRKKITDYRSKLLYYH